MVDAKSRCGARCVRKISTAVFSLLFLSCSHLTFAQVFPVQGVVFVKPPYTPHIGAYTEPGSQKLMLQLRANDLSIVNHPVKLRVTIDGVGITIRTKPSSVFQPIYIEGGAPMIIYGEDIAEYFQAKNLDFAGYSQRDYEKTGRLPEGVYQVSVEVLDYNRNTVISNRAMTMVWMILNDPPLLNLPRDNSKILIVNPTLIPFNWTPRHTGSPNAAFTTEYIFRLVEIWPASRNPNDAFLSQTPLYEVTTGQSQIVYGMSEPPLLPGRKYAWQVQAVDTEGRDLFKNNGKSVVHVFQFGDPIAAPENFRKEMSTDITLSLRWEPPMAGAVPQRYRLQYRALNGQTWYEEVTESRWITLGNLTPETEYELQIRSEGNNQVSDYTATKRFRTESKMESNYTCGSPIEQIPVLDSTPLPALVPGDVFKCGDMNILVSEVSEPSSSGQFSGKGWQTINLLNSAKILVTFSGTFNSKYEMITGRTESVRDENNAVSQLIDEMKKIGEDKIAVFHARDTIQPASIAEYQFAGAIDTIYVDAQGEVIVQNAAGEQTSYLADGKTIIIEDDAGNSYTVENGKVRSNGSTATTSVAANVNYSITFDSSPTQQFGFDKPEYPQLDLHYSTENIKGNNYSIPWKAVAVGATDVVKAIASQKRTDLSKEAGFKSDIGPLPRLPGSDTEVEITVQGRSELEVEQVTAFLSRKDADGNESDETIGRLNVISYNKMLKKLVLIPVNNAAVPAGFSASQIEQELNKVYGQAVVQWFVEVAPSMQSNYDTDNDGLEYGTSILNNYTGEMRTIINDFTKDQSILPETYYLFLVPKATEPHLTGYMPRRKQIGFLFTDNLNTTNFIKTIGHELGHGAFRLEHTFPELPQQGNNLMDYSISGTHLHKHQWDYVHDPVGALALWDGDEESAAYDCPMWFSGECESVGRILDLIKKNSTTGVGIKTTAPRDETRKELIANNIELDGTRFSKIKIVNLVEQDSVYHYDPRDFESYSQASLNADGGSDFQRGFIYRTSPTKTNPAQLFAPQKPIIVKILLYEDEAKFDEKLDALKNYLYGDIPTAIMAEILKAFEGEVLTASSIKSVRELIAKVAEPEKRKNYYSILQEKVPYHNQRDNQSIATDEDVENNADWLEKGGTIGDIMCNMTALAACLEYLGKEKPCEGCPTCNSTLFPDYLECVHRDKIRPLGADDYHRGTALSRKLLAEYFNVGQGLSENFKTSKELKDFLEDKLTSGFGVMASIGGHLVRIQGVDENHVFVDDPYGNLDINRKLSGLNAYRCKGCDPQIDTRNKDSDIRGDNSKWPIEDAVKILLRFEWYYNN
jgi:hypothetical protein